VSDGPHLKTREENESVKCVEGTSYPTAICRDRRVEVGNVEMAEMIVGGVSRGAPGFNPM